MIMIPRPRGTRDFKPEDMLLRRFIEGALQSTALKFGYQEVATPTFENAELFLRKSGAGILDQIYLFRDKGDRELVLRPELTAPVIRFYANELYKQPKPLKLFYLGNCFRYERPQKGRFREFWQFGAELIGTNEAVAIAELIAFAHACITNNNLKNFELRIGYLEILKKILTSWEIPVGLQAKLMIVIDKGDLDSLQGILNDAGLTEAQITTFSELVQDKFNLSDSKDRFKVLSERFPMITEYLDRLKNIIGFLQVFGIQEVTIDLGIARGLDYYTGIVFEIDVHSLGAEKQVCGGGEYSLDEIFDLKDVSCAGFAIGFDRIALAYELEGRQALKTELDIFIIPLTKPGLEKAVEISNQLRNAGFNVDLDLKSRNMSKNLKFASSRGAKFVIFLGEDELTHSSALIRAMSTGDQNTVKFEELIEYFENLS